MRNVHVDSLSGCHSRGRLGPGLVAAGLVFGASLLAGVCCARDEGRSTPLKEKLVFVYLHGFGGVKKNPRFCVNLREFLAKVDCDCEVRNYEWDSVDIKVAKAGANWLEAEKKADAEAKAFKSSVIDRLEMKNTPYVLVGFSIGSRVILRALEESGGNLRMLRGVYFLGAAMTRDTSIDERCLPLGMKIINYHSPLRDSVHRIAFNFMEKIPAGGLVGFDNKDVFDNYAVSCTHAYKGVGPHIDYSQLAYAIGYIALLKERVFIPGGTAYNIATPVGKGEVWWNKILRMDCTIKEQPCTLEIEQFNLDLSYFRAIVVSSDGTRRRAARGNNLHAILNDLGVLPKSYWRTRKSGRN